MDSEIIKSAATAAAEAAAESAAEVLADQRKKEVEETEREIMRESFRLMSDEIATLSAAISELGGNIETAISKLQYIEIMVAELRAEEPEEIAAAVVDEMREEIVTLPAEKTPPETAETPAPENVVYTPQLPDNNPIPPEEKKRKWKLIN